MTLYFIVDTESMQYVTLMTSEGGRWTRSVRRRDVVENTFGFVFAPVTEARKHPETYVITGWPHEPKLKIVPGHIVKPIKLLVGDSFNKWAEGKECSNSGWDDPDR